MPSGIGLPKILCCYAQLDRIGSGRRCHVFEYGRFGSQFLGQGSGLFDRRRNFCGATNSQSYSKNYERDSSNDFYHGNCNKDFDKFDQLHSVLQFDGVLSVWQHEHSLNNEHAVRYHQRNLYQHNCLHRRNSPSATIVNRNKFHSFRPNYSSNEFICLNFPDTDIPTWYLAAFSTRTEM